eukprot:1661620-Prymnesium_polylepis.1
MTRVPGVNMLKGFEALAKRYSRLFCLSESELRKRAAASAMEGGGGCVGVCARALVGCAARVFLRFDPVAFARTLLAVYGHMAHPRTVGAHANRACGGCSPYQCRDGGGSPAPARASQPDARAVGPPGHRRLWRGGRGLKARAADLGQDARAARRGTARRGTRLLVADGLQV